MKLIKKNDVTFNIKDEDHLPSKTLWDRYTKNEWEPETFTLLDMLVKKGNIVVDVGTWVGPVSLYAAKKGATVIGYEPDPIAYNVFQENIKTNPDLIDKITVKEKALSNKDEIKSFYAIDKFGHSGASLNNFSKATTEVKVVCRDGYSELKDIDWEKVCLLKIDIEGGEFILIPHIKSLLEKHKPNLYLSLHVKQDKKYVRYGMFFRILKASIDGMKITYSLRKYKNKFIFTNNKWMRWEDLPSQNIKQKIRNKFLIGYKDAVFCTEKNLNVTDLTQPSKNKLK